jgi:hypothetical protein
MALLLMACAAISLDLCLLPALHGHSLHPNSMNLLCAAISIASVFGIARILTQLDSFLPCFVLPSGGWNFTPRSALAPEWEILLV